MTAWFALLLLSVTPSQEAVVSRLFAATSDGPFITYSWGEHWTRLRGDLRGFTGEIRTFTCLGPAVFAGGSDGIFVSDDFGENFRPVESWPGGSVTTFLAARLFALEPTLFAGTHGGLYRSTDGGSGWARVGEGVLGSAVHAMRWPGPELFVASERGLFRSEDGGERFERIEAGLPDVPLLSIELSRFFALNPTVFIGTRGKGLYRSLDGGEHFERVGRAELASSTVRALFWWGSLLLVGTNDGLLTTNDGGESFGRSRELEGRRVLAITVPLSNNGLQSDILVGTDEGVYKSSDGGYRFRPVREGLGEPSVMDLATFPEPPQSRERSR